MSLALTEPPGYRPTVTICGVGEEVPVGGLDPTWTMGQSRHVGAVGRAGPEPITCSPAGRRGTAYEC